MGYIETPSFFWIWTVKDDCIGNFLCKLHNFCIDSSDPSSSGLPLEVNLAVDTAHLRATGTFHLEDTPGNPLHPGAVIGGGEHFDDVSRNVRRQAARTCHESPRDRMLDTVVQKSLVRPRPASWR